MANYVGKKQDERDNINDLSGPGGAPVTRSDPEIEFERDGRFKGRQTPKVKRNQIFLDFKSGSGWQHEGSNSSLPSNPNGPRDGLLTKPYSRQPLEEKLVSFLNRAIGKTLVVAKNVFFKDVLAQTKSLYPGLKLILPKPLTYVWNPGAPAPQGKEGEEAAPESGSDQKIDIQGIKNRITMKFPDLKWSTRPEDGVLSAQLAFKDGSYCEFAIGADANHLTLTYYT